MKKKTRERLLSKQVSTRHRTPLTAPGEGGLSTFRNVTNPLEVVVPSSRHAVAVFGWDFAHRAMREGKPGAGTSLCQSILQVVDRGVGHGKRAGDFQQFRRLEHLNMPPQVSGVIAEI